MAPPSQHEIWAVAVIGERQLEGHTPALLCCTQEVTTRQLHTQLIGHSWSPGFTQWPGGWEICRQQIAMFGEPTVTRLLQALGFGGGASVPTAVTPARKWQQLGELLIGVEVKWINTTVEK